MDDLVAFVRQQLDEDEQVATEAADYGAAWRDGDGAIYPSDDSRHPGAMITGAYGDLPDRYAEHIARWDPARVLAEVEAKRDLIGHIEGLILYATSPNYAHGGIEAWANRALTMLAQPYAGREGWREEWREEWRAV